MKETLVILTPGFPKDEADSTCLPPQQVFVRALQEQYPQLEIIMISFQYPYHAKTYTWHGITVISAGGKNKGSLYRLLLWQKINKKLKRLAETKSIKGVLSFWCGECALIGKRFSKKYHYPHYSWILGQDAKKENRYTRWIQPQPGELIALSDFIQEEFERNHRIKPEHIILPGIDTRLFIKNNNKRNLDVLAAGSLIPLKQYAVFIEVIAALKKTNPGIKAILAGNGPEKEKLQQLITEHDLDNAITLTGELPHEEVLQLMQRTKIFLHPSSYEGFGVVCIEALYAGATVISFCKPMKEEIKNWFIAIDTNNMITLAERLMQMNLSYEPVLYNDIRNSAVMMGKVFDLMSSNPGK